MDSNRPEIEENRRNFRVVKGGVAERSASKPVAGNPLARDWQIQLTTWPRKIIVVLLICTTTGMLIYRTWWLFLAAWITRNKTMDAAIYERATRYDPKNADYHFVLGQIYNYATADLNLDRAREEYEAAARLNPAHSGYWLELSKLYEQDGNTERARFAMTKALETDPNYAQTHWAAANLYVRLADQKAADYELRRAADLDARYTIQVLDLVWAVYENPDLIMSTHIPNTKDANLIALNYFMTHASVKGAELAWNRLKSFETTPQERNRYVDYLISQAQTHAAWDVFSTGLPKVEGVPPFYNASFESEPLNGGFDWRIASSDDAEVRRDPTTVKDGMASLIISFSGKQNPVYGQVWHWLPVEKGKNYVVKFWIKTDSISTNEGIYLNIEGQSSEKQLGSTSWQELSIPFKAATDIVKLVVSRDSSRKFDNLLKGKVWLDGFSITAEP